jgi:hypothetical protein
MTDRNWLIREKIKQRLNEVVYPPRGGDFNIENNISRSLPRFLS